MPKIGNVGFVHKTLKDNNLQAKKKFGQNFLTDQNILSGIVNASEVTKRDAVIEIGPGLGALTEHLCEQAGFVLAYEIDTDLLPLLKENLKQYNNYKVINQDILKADVNADIDQYLKDYENVYVVANLPYYITTPIILGLLSKETRISRYVMMMQLEMADRICGKPKTKDYNALSVVIAYKAVAKKVLNVPRTVFIPAPNVDSAVVRLDIHETKPYQALDEETFNKVIRVCFTQRRKTLYNNLSMEYPKDFVNKLLQDLNINPSIRSEALDIKDFILISDYITQNYRK